MALELNPQSPGTATHEPTPNSIVPVQPTPISPSEHAKPHPPPDTEGAMITLSTGEGAGSKNRDEALAKLNHDKTHSHIRAWEENEKAISVNKFNKVISKINAWENSKKATAEAKLRKKEEALEKQRAAYVERMKNEIAAVHRTAEEKRAVAEAKKGEELVKAEELAAKYRASGQAPKRFLCFGA